MAKKNPFLQKGKDPVGDNDAASNPKQKAVGKKSAFVPFQKGKPNGKAGKK